MTFLSLTPDQFEATVAARTEAGRRRRGAPLFAQAVAAMIVAIALTVPGAVAQAKWSKLTLIVTIVQHRAMSAFSA